MKSLDLRSAARHDKDDILAVSAWKMIDKRMSHDDDEGQHVTS